MPELAANEPPPPDYYAANVRQVLDYVQSHYADLLDARSRAYIQVFRGLSVSAQRLYARLISRKGPWLRTDKLNYTEVSHVDIAIAELAEAGLITLNPNAPADSLLALFTQQERFAVFPRVPKQRKAAWIESCISRYSEAGIRARIAADYQWLAVNFQRERRLCQLLFFGDEYQDLSTFVMRDLGLTRYETYELSPAVRQFDDRDSLARYLQLRRLRRLARGIDEFPTLADELVQRLLLSPENRLEQRQLDKTANHLGYYFERRGDFDAALSCYSCSQSHPGAERTARVLKKLGDDIGVAAELSRMRQTPRCAEEEDFAQRFGQRGLKPDIPVTSISLIQDTPEHIEAFAMELLTADGGQAWHLENRFPLAVTGLLFWDVVFAPIKGAFVNPFQSGPVDLSWPDFARAREVEIEHRHQTLMQPGAVYGALNDVWHAKYGVANRLVSWRHCTLEWLECVHAAIPEEQLLKLALHVLRNLYRARTGFPDLFVAYASGDYEFVEVKGPGDQLQPGQRVWFKSLKQLALPARVLKFNR